MQCKGRLSVMMPARSGVVRGNPRLIGIALQLREWSNVVTVPHAGLFRLVVQCQQHQAKSQHYLVKPSYPNTGFRNLLVQLPFTLAASSGVPRAMTLAVDQ